MHSLFPVLEYTAAASVDARVDLDERMVGVRDFFSGKCRKCTEKCLENGIQFL